MRAMVAQLRKLPLHWLAPAVQYLSAVSAAGS